MTRIPDSLISVINAIPNKPGIYIFRDSHGLVLYVGKSVNLRNRVRSYFNANSSKQSQIKNMIRSIYLVEYQLAHSELHALLLEDKVIKQHLPPYNTKQKEYPEYRYLYLTQDPYPALKEIAASEGLSADRIFGPFKDTYFIAELLALITPIFQIRTCSDSIPCRKCLNHELGKCLGPCFNPDILNTYSLNVTQLYKFLSGDCSFALQHLQKQLSEYTSQLKYEGAAECLSQQQFLERFCEKQHFYLKFTREQMILPDVGCFHIFACGSYIDTTTTHENASIIFNTISTDDLTIDPRYAYDLANIVFRYAHLDLGKSNRI